MTKRSCTMPADYAPDHRLRAWARDKFGIADAEIDRQLEWMRDYEFARPYGKWDLVFRNWMRRADERGALKRERKLRQPVELSAQERQLDLIKWEQDMQRLNAMRQKARG